MTRGCVLVLLIASIAFAGFGVFVRADIPVIPNAPFQQGFGIDTPAGSGRHLATPNTTIYKVTNLNDYDPSGTPIAGSLRYGIYEISCPKVIIFEISGTITLVKPLEVKDEQAYITIAGQTAPSPGITIRGNFIKIERNTHDILIQHIRFRPGDAYLNGAYPDSIDSLTIDNHYSVELGWNPPYNVVIDHCSFSWSIDENIDSGSNDTTFINNIISEGLSSPLHSKGGHSKGLMLLAYNYGISGAHNVLIANNLFAHNEGRNPVIFSGKSVVANNVVHDYKFGIKVEDGNAKKGPIQVSVVGNYFIDSPIENPYPVYICAGVQEETRVYLANDNFFMGMIHTDPWNTIHPNHQRLTVSDASSSVPEVNRALSPPIWPEGYTTMSAADAKTYVLANAGARPADRDSVDVRIVNDVKNGTGGIIASQDDVGGWPNLAKNIRTLTVPSNPNEVQASGYTKLEEWLHGYSALVEGDSTPPSRSNPQPNGTLSSGTTSINISLTTNIQATCRYSNVSGTNYTEMEYNFTYTNSTSHLTPVSGLENGKNYTFYVRCNSSDGYVNEGDFNITFSVDGHKADINDDGTINMRELITFIARWKANDGVSRQEVEEARDIWFSGGDYGT